MSDSNFKAIRKQLRNVVQEILGDVLKSELMASVHKDVAAQVDARLDVIQTQVNETMKQLDARSKDVQSYIVRQAAKDAPVAADAEIPTPA